MSKFITVEPNRGLTPNKKGKVVDKPCLNGLFNCYSRGCYFRHAEKGDTPISSIEPADVPTNSVKFAVSVDKFVSKLPECGSIALGFKQPLAPPKVEDFSNYMSDGSGDKPVDPAIILEMLGNLQELDEDFVELSEKFAGFFTDTDVRIGDLIRGRSEQAQKIVLLESTVRNQEGKIDLLERMLMSMDKAFASLRRELYESQQQAK